jgi:DNA repair photolyase
VNVEKVKNMFLHPESTQFGPYIKERRPMQWGGLADPFDENERLCGVGLELLRFFREIDYPLSFSTKGTWWLDDERYRELFKGNKNWHVKVSIITGDERKAKIIERGVPSPNERLAAIELLAALGGGGATLRLRPFIIGVSSPGHCELIASAAKRGATSVSTEFFCLEMRSRSVREILPTMSREAGFNLLPFYKKHSNRAGYLRLNREVKRKYVDEMEQAATEHGMRFYVSDADFKERSTNGCCCGLSEDWNYTRGQFCHAIHLCRKNGRVTWVEIEPDLSYAKTFLWKQAAGYNCNSSERMAQFDRHTMYDYIRWLWNNPTAGQSPYKMYGGVMKPVDKDKDGNLIYEYDKTRT